MKLFRVENHRNNWKVFTHNLLNIIHSVPARISLLHSTKPTTPRCECNKKSMKIILSHPAIHHPNQVLATGSSCSFPFCITSYWNSFYVTTTTTPITRFQEEVLAKCHKFTAHTLYSDTQSRSWSWGNADWELVLCFEWRQIARAALRNWNFPILSATFPYVTLTRSSIRSRQ